MIIRPCSVHAAFGRRRGDGTPNAKDRVWEPDACVARTVFTRSEEPPKGGTPNKNEIAATPTVAGQEPQWRRRICDNFFVPEPLLDASTLRRFAPAPGVQVEGLTYRTQLGLLVPAILCLPDPMPAERIPAFIVVSGHGGDKHAWYSWYTGILFARGGAHVRPGWGRRAKPPPSIRYPRSRQHQR